MARLFSSEESKKGLISLIGFFAWGLCYLILELHLLLSAIIGALVSGFFFWLFGLAKKNKAGTLIRSSAWKSLGDATRSAFSFLGRNWFAITALLMAAFGIYWIGVRPDLIRAECSVVRTYHEAKLAVPASSDWPQCQTTVKEAKERVRESSSTDLLDAITRYQPLSPERIEEMNLLQQLEQQCYPEKDAVPARMTERPATSREYNECLRSHGLDS